MTTVQVIFYPYVQSLQRTFRGYRYSDIQKKTVQLHAGGTMKDLEIMLTCIESATYSLIYGWSMVRRFGRLVAPDELSKVPLEHVVDRESKDAAAHFAFCVVEKPLGAMFSQLCHCEPEGDHWEKIGVPIPLFGIYDMDYKQLRKHVHNIVSDLFEQYRSVTPDRMPYHLALCDVTGREVLEVDIPLNGPNQIREMYKTEALSLCCLWHHKYNDWTRCLPTKHEVVHGWTQKADFRGRNYFWW